jgi:hypothetical protein
VSKSDVFNIEARCLTSPILAGHDVDNFGDAVTQLQLYLNGSESNYSFVSIKYCLIAEQAG